MTGHHQLDKARDSGLVLTAAPKAIAQSWVLIFQGPPPFKQSK